MPADDQVASLGARSVGVADASVRRTRGQVGAAASGAARRGSLPVGDAPLPVDPAGSSSAATFEILAGAPVSAAPQPTSAAARVRGSVLTGTGADVRDGWAVSGQGGRRPGRLNPRTPKQQDEGW